MVLYDSISAPDLSGDYDNLTDSEFDKVVDSLPLTLTLYDGAPLAPTVEESDLIPNARDVFVIRHPRYTRPNLHDILILKLILLPMDRVNSSLNKKNTL